MTYKEFQALIDEYRDHTIAYTLRHERNRPKQEQLEALTAAVKAQEALWDAIRTGGSTRSKPWMNQT